MLVLELIPSGVKATGARLFAQRWSEGYKDMAAGCQSLRGDHSCRACDGCATGTSARLDMLLEQAPDLTCCGPRVSGKTLISYNAWMLPGDETHRHRVHNNGGGGRGTLAYIVDHKKPEIQCTVKHMAQAVDGR
jgi:hypothetical protein